ncbi:HNH endonuclease [Arthrobacter sp. NPDC090010]|uniref:HNH endonuclease n=1 Tax=Arthrobacter sp. NPDC090010 TaxID=3363942 RepID=UPI0037FB79C1
MEAGGYEFRREFLRTKYVYQGRVIPLMDAQTGIWNPAGFDATLSVTTTLKGPYADDVGGAVLKYSYERLPGRPLTSGRNLKLRAAAVSETPLILFQEILPALYLPRYPVFVERDDPDEGYVYLGLEESLDSYQDMSQSLVPGPRYAERWIKTRLHQKRFRSLVLHAYESRCAVCLLSQPVLLDAAHITPDGAPGSIAAVSNGLALCKLHHAAYDGNLLGIDGDYRVSVKDEVLAESGGSMLRHGLQDMDGCAIRVPRRASERPDPERLQRRFVEFSGSVTIRL